MNGNYKLRIPKNLRIYAVGDIHGRADLLAQVFSKIDRDLKMRPIGHAIEVYLGDYIDRGPHSATVLKQLIWRRKFKKIVCLRGNHENLLLNFLRQPASLDEWQQVGGFETILSYGVVPSLQPTDIEKERLSEKLAQALPDAHYDFLLRLHLWFSCGDFFFVHAGVRPSVPLFEQSEDDLISIRTDFLNHRGDFGGIIVHGHTPVAEPEILWNRINIDTGAYATGRLTCFAFEDGTISTL